MELPSSVSVVSIFTLLLISTVQWVAFATSPCHFPAIFNFGDSNSDTGGLSAVFGQAPPPHGESYFHHPAGRYCDGRLIIDFIGTSYFSLFLLLILRKEKNLQYL
jgi:hypothetical protein